MEIPGTHRTTFDILLDTKFNKGDILSAIDENMEVLSSKLSNINYLHNCAVTLTGEELEIAIKHFKFLLKYNLL